ncbi:MAG: hypothetical protein LBH28_07380 [Oscillospiraceae bacterium]|jgi:hypothetical protein|nr:hypothetical protein [Oscillospiraceae bacterium]
MKRKLIISVAVLAAVVFVSGASILAVASSGSESDPFVTLSFLTDVFRPQIMVEIDKTDRELSEKFDARISEFEARLQSSLGSAAEAHSSADVFSVVTLTSGQSLTCSVGAELMLRVGNATGFGSAPALVDYTGGSTLASGASLIANHMYLVTIEGNGVNAAAGTVRLLVRGNYTIE